MSNRWMMNGALALAMVMGLGVAASAQAKGNSASPFATGDELLIGGSGLFTRSTPVNSLEYTSSSSGALDLGFRMQFTDKSALLVRYSFSDYTHTEGNASNLPANSYQNILNVQAYADELAVEYNYCWTFGNIRPYALGGLGVISFVPTSASTNTAGASAELKGEILYGGGVDYAFNSKWALRGEYRVQVFTTPLFRYPNAGLPSWTQTYDPSVSLLYHFGG